MCVCCHDLRAKLNHNPWVEASPALPDQILVVVLQYVLSMRKAAPTAPHLLRTPCPLAIPQNTRVRGCLCALACVQIPTTARWPHRHRQDCVHAGLPGGPGPRALRAPQYAGLQCADQRAHGAVAHRRQARQAAQGALWRKGGRRRGTRRLGPGACAECQSAVCV